MKTTVLFVEDSKFIGIAAERSLTKPGFTVVRAQDGEEGLRLAAQVLPDVILLDMLLPKTRRSGSSSRSESRPLTARIPVIILGSLAQQNEEKLKKAGAAAYFEKAKLIEDDNSGKLNDAIATLCVNRDSEAIRFDLNLEGRGSGTVSIREAPTCVS